MFEFFRPRPPQTSAAPYSWPWVFAMPKPASAEPAWDAKGHTALCAFARLRELEDEPKKHGGKAGAKQVRDRLEARQRAWKLLDEWAEDRRLDGRPGEDGSMTHGHMSPVRDVRK